MSTILDANTPVVLSTDPRLSTISGVTFAFPGRIKIESCPTPSSDGQIGYNGTNILFRSGGSNKFCPAVPSGAGGTLYDNGSDWVRLAPGVSGQFLKCNGITAPSWIAESLTITNSYAGSDEFLSGTGISFTSVAIPASALAVGSVYQVVFTGYNLVCDSGNSIKLYIGTNAVVVGSGPLTSGTWTIKGSFSCRTTGGSGSIAYAIEFVHMDIITNNITSTNSSSTVTINTANSVSIYTYIDSGSGTQTQAAGMLIQA